LRSAKRREDARQSGGVADKTARPRKSTARKSTDRERTAAVRSTPSSYVDASASAKASLKPPIRELAARDRKSGGPGLTLTSGGRTNVVKKQAASTGNKVPLLRESRHIFGHVLSRPAFSRYLFLQLIFSRCAAITTTVGNEKFIT
jgi:hypothetical protein